MNKNIITVKNLQKTFSFNVKKENTGFWRSMIVPQKQNVKAVNNISFTVKKGETVAFIGPNGAGKSTTIKMLTGILYPTAGQITVAGLSPQKARQKLAYKIGTVFGQRSQLMYNLPVKSSFKLFGSIYDLPDSLTDYRMHKLVKTFDLAEFIDQPVRKLSLGQRMRAEIAVALLHEPEIIFLDEPTIGLDVVAKRRLRKTLRQLNKEQKTTIFLTSHDAGDIEAITDRTIVINHGEIIMDAPTVDLKKKVLTEKLIIVECAKLPANLNLRGAKIKSQEGNKIIYLVDIQQDSLNNVIKQIVNKFTIVDLDVENPNLEEVIETIFTKKKDEKIF